MKLGSENISNLLFFESDKIETSIPDLWAVLGDDLYLAYH